MSEVDIVRLLNTITERLESLEEAVTDRLDRIDEAIQNLNLRSRDYDIEEYED